MFTADESPMANLLLSVMGAFAEFERALIKERQLEGIALAKKRGAYKGRKKALNAEQVQDLKRRVAAGEQKKTIGIRGKELQGPFLSWFFLRSVHRRVPIGRSHRSKYLAVTS